MELQTEGHAQMAGELEAGGWREEAWICMCGLISLLPPPPLHGKTGEHGAGSVGGGSNNTD